MTTTIYRVELDDIDDETAQIRWFTDRAKAQALVDQTAAEHPDMEADDAPDQDPGEYDYQSGRPAVMATMHEIDVELTEDGVCCFLNEWASTAEPE